ncbi:hypothetical protein RRF57_002599 [Xylaria bambusicola]|uniref:Uncharacterized protein n=1 Tax=Xylaria bambusicola TaxID=326684 RepID=A0AAN7UT45_9PEZI
MHSKDLSDETIPCTEVVRSKIVRSGIESINILELVCGLGVIKITFSVREPMKKQKTHFVPPDFIDQLPESA